MESSFVISVASPRIEYFYKEVSWAALVVKNCYAHHSVRVIEDQTPLIEPLSTFCGKGHRVTGIIVVSNKVPSSIGTRELVRGVLEGEVKVRESS